jgi:Secretion system C-terminal sorting domain
MKKIYLIILFIVANSYSQNFQWVDFPPVTYGLSTNNLGYSITADDSGNVYAVGFKNNYFLSSEIYGNLFYRKYDANGTLIFDKEITGKVRSINLTNDNVGNVYLVAGFKNTITFDGGGSINTSNTNEEIILIKFDQNGAFQWNKIISNFGSFNHCSAIATDINNNVLIGFDNFNNSKILRLSSTTGNITLTIDQLNVQVISSISVDNFGSIYAAGSCGKPTSTFAGVLQPTNLSYSIYAVKYNSNGAHAWTKYAEDISCLDPIISAKTSNDIYLSSSLSGAFAFGSLTAQGPPSGFSDDIFITKLNANGDFVWLREVYGSGKASIGNRNFLTSDSSGNVYFAGSTKSSTVWSPIISTVVAGFNADVLILKYNSNGNILMAKTAGGSLTDSCDGIAIGDFGNIYVAGITSGPSNFDLFNYATGKGPFVAKIGNLLNLNENKYLKKINIYPNPANNEINISNLESKTNGFIYNSIGQKVKVFEAENNSTISISELTTGIYFLKLDGFISEKLIKN